jgi:hypothetical protein
LNIASYKELYFRIKCEDILNWVKKICLVKNGEYIEYGIIAIILMIDNAELEDYSHFTEDIIEIVVNKCIISDKITEQLLDRVFILIDKFLQK